MGEQRLGFIGLGAMGFGMAARMVQLGHTVTVFNRTPARSAQLGEMGASVAGSPAELAQNVDVLFLSLANSDAVDEILFGRGGCLTVPKWHGTVADLSTVSPDFARDVARRVAAVGGRALDTCVLGNAQHAKDGQLRFLVGGEREDYDVVHPILAGLGKEVVHLGGHGMGATLKLALNSLMGVQLQAMAEAVALSEAAGLDRDDVLAMISASGFSSPVMRFKAEAMRTRAFDEVHFKLALMEKDMALAMAEGERLDIPTPVVKSAYEVLATGSRQGVGHLDCAAVADYARWPSREANGNEPHYRE